MTQLKTKDWREERVREERERLEREFGDFAHEHYLGCHDENGKWYYSYDTEVVYLINQFFTPTKTDNPNINI